MIPTSDLRRFSTASAKGSITKREQIGAVVVGGDHPGLAIARSLGRRGIPVVVIDDQYSISKISKQPWIPFLKWVSVLG
jgi:ribulose 1,5-bisphosphate synthetase/thiazole synthase